MWKLTIMDDEGKQTELTLSRGEYAVGRGEQNTVRLTDRNISRTHLTIRRNNDDRWEVEDLASYNGCFVNGTRVTGTHPLCHGDLLQLGDYRLGIRDEALLEGLGTNAARKSVLLDRPDRLVVVDGTAAGTEYPLERERIIVGRAEGSDIIINHSSVSRTHAEIVQLGAGLYELFDRGSSNGIRVNGVKFERRTIEDDDEIELGDFRLRFVSRGRIFVPGTPPRALRHMTMLPDANRKVGLGYMVAVGAAVGFVVAFALIVAFRYSGNQSVEVVEHVPLDRSLVTDAFGLSLEGKHEDAHERITELSSDSPLRSDDRVLAIEKAWAEDTLARASASDQDARRALLMQVVDSPLVSSELRGKARTELRRMDPANADTNALPVAVNVDSVATNGDSGHTVSATDLPAAGPLSGQASGATTRTSSSNPSRFPPGVSSQVYRKVLNGTATEQETRSLRAECRNLDKAHEDFKNRCVSACNARLDQLGR